MPNAALIAICSATLGIAIAGSIWTVRVKAFEPVRISLLAVYAAFAALVGVPLILAYSSALYLFYLPLVLPVLLAIPPIVFRFVVAWTEKGGVAPVRMHHFFLPLAGALVTLGYWFQPFGNKRTMFEQGELPPGFMPSALALMTFILLFVWVLASFAYLAGTVRHLRIFRERLKDEYSNTSGKELRWIDWFMVFLVTVWAAAALSLIGDNSPLPVSFPGSIVIGLMALLLLFLMAFAPTGFRENWRQVPADSDPSPLTHPPVETTAKYARTALTKDHTQRLSDRIEQAMREDRLFLDPNLSLQKLSRHVGALPNHVSQTLNEEIGSTFFDYVARWRVEMAKPLIAAGEATVLAVALDVGFNSRSTFYKAFRRETGMTPKAFQNQA